MFSIFYAICLLSCVCYIFATFSLYISRPPQFPPSRCWSAGWPLGEGNELPSQATSAKKGSIAIQYQKNTLLPDSDLFQFNFDFGDFAIFSFKCV